MSIRINSKGKHVYPNAKRHKESFSEVDINFTAREMNVLYSKPPELWLLYIYLSTCRDFDTNIAGQKTRISDKSFKEVMSYPGQRGRPAKKPSTTHISRWLDQLEEIGLIKKMGNHVFFLPLAPSSVNPSKSFVTNHVTNFVTGFVTKPEVAETPIVAEQNTTYDNHLSPPLSPPLSPVSVYTSDMIRSDMKRSEQEQVFLNLLEKRQFPISYLIHSKTVAMLKVLAENKFTKEEVEEAMLHADASLGARPKVPWYYLDPILQKRKEMEYAREKANRINEESRDETNRPRTTTTPTTGTVRPYKGYRSKDEERATARRELEEWAKEREKEELEAERSGD